MEAHGKILAHFHLNRVWKNGRKEKASDSRKQVFFPLRSADSLKRITAVMYSVSRVMILCLIYPARESQRLFLHMVSISLQKPAGGSLPNTYQPWEVKSPPALGRNPFTHKDLADKNVVSQTTQNSRLRGSMSKRK